MFKYTQRQVFMLKRKIYNELQLWHNTENRKPLVIKGLRQVGKTYIVKKFAEENYDNVIYIDFRKNRQLRSLFESPFVINDLISQITANIPGSRALPYRTLLIFDEVQDCPNARSSLKYFYEDGRYDVICTGSLLGIKGYSQKGDNAVPVGYEEVIYMKPMDFEEFLWAEGIDDSTVFDLQTCLNERKEILPATHARMSDLFRKYICVGGMPEVVQAFTETGDMNRVLKLQRSILESYKDDFGRHLKDDNSLYTDEKELAAILAVFNSIPAQLAKENKKFQFSKITKKGRNDEFRRALQWLEDAGIISRCYNLSTTELPLEGNRCDDVFKVYMQDSGLFVAMLEEGTQADILNGNLLIYKGALYENIIADAFSKMGRKLYYFHKDSGLEIDFVTRYKGRCTLMEVKANNGRSKSLNNMLSDYERYHVDSAIKFRDGNIEQNGRILFLPHYLAFLIREY